MSHEEELSVSPWAVCRFSSQRPEITKENKMKNLKKLIAAKKWSLRKQKHYETKNKLSINEIERRRNKNRKHRKISRIQKFTNFIPFFIFYRIQEFLLVE